MAVSTPFAVADSEGGPSSDSASFLPSLAPAQALEDVAADAQTIEGPSTDPQAAEELPHEDLDRAGAEDLLTSVFPAALDEPAGIFDDLEVDAFRSDHVALVSAGNKSADGNGTERPALLTSILPLRAEAPDGSKQPVDLALENVGGQLQPINPLVEVEIPHSLEKGIALPESDVSIGLQDSSIERAASTIADGAAFYPNVAPDSDLIVLPTPTGVETLTQLRSPSAPTIQAFHLDLPSGANMAATDDGGATIMRADEPLIAVRPPTAIDAEGSDVPVSLEVSGDSISLHVDPSASAAYPILVDPVYESYSWLNTNTNTGIYTDWLPGSSNEAVLKPSWIGVWDQTMHSGMNLRSYASPVAPYSQATWSYFVPRYFTDFADPSVHEHPTTFIRNMTLSQVYFFVEEGAPVHQHPYMMVGLWNENKAAFASVGTHTSAEGNYNGVTLPLPNPSEQTDVKWGGIWLLTQEAASYPRQAFVGQATVELSDKDVPGFGFVNSPGGWVRDEPSLPIDYLVSDPGLGVFQLQVVQPNAKGGTTQINSSANCVGTASVPCPRSLKASQVALNYAPAMMPQGENWLKVTASDPTGQKSSVSEARVKVDHTAPKLAPLAGTLTEQGTLGTKLTQYSLKYSAADGDEATPEALTPFGGAGSGEGKTGRPLGMAADGKGNVWVVDRENNRVMKFDESGKFLFQFGSKGSGNGQLLEPRGIAIGSKGTLWVTDTGNNRVQEFSTTGQYLQQFGSKGTGKTQFQEVYGITAAPGGVLWVGDMVRNRIAAFRETPTSGQDPYFIREVQGSSSNANKTDLLTPNLMAVDSFGNLWVADAGHHRIQEFDSEGKYLFQFGTEGTGPGQLYWPGAIAIAPSGNLIVVDSGNNRMQEFKPDGSFMRQFGSNGAGNGQFLEPRGIILGPGNTALIADAGNHRIVRWAHVDLDPQSGVVKGEIKVDGTVVDSIAPGCATKTCAIGPREWTLKADDYAVGPHAVEVVATDGVGLATNSKITIETHGDLAAPSVALSGAMTEQVTLGTTRPTYKLNVAATDPGSSEERQSGVASTTIKVDGKVVDTTSPGCSAGGCSISREWTLKSDSYAVGPHVVQVTATDAAGRSTSKGLTINIARDTTAPELTATNPIFTVPGGWVTQKSYVYFPSATDPNGYGLASLVFKVDGVTVATTTKTCEAGGCSAQLLGSLNIASYDGGAHPAELKATDGAGNWRKREWTINVDPSGAIPEDEVIATMEASDETSGSNTVGTTGTEAPEELPLSGDLALEEEADGFTAPEGAAPVLIEHDPEEGITVRIPADGVDEEICPFVEQDLVEEQPSEPVPPVEHVEPCDPQIAIDDGLIDREPVEITPVNVSSAASDLAVDSSSTTAVSANVQGNVDQLMRPLYNGAQTFMAIRDGAAPVEYSWRVELEDDQQLQLVDAQHAAVLWDSGNTAFTITATKAHDAIGTELPTSLSVTGDVLTLNVPHRVPSPVGGSYVYPVSAGAGWQGGFQTYEVTMPPPETQEEAEEIIEHVDYWENEDEARLRLLSASAPRPSGKSENGEEKFYSGFRWSECRYAWTGKASVPNIPRREMLGMYIGKCAKRETSLKSGFTVYGVGHLIPGKWIWVNESPREIHCAAWGWAPGAPIHCFARPWKSKNSVMLRGDFRLGSGGVGLYHTAECITMYADIFTTKPYIKIRENTVTFAGADEEFEKCDWPD